MNNQLGKKIKDLDNGESLSPSADADALGVSATYFLEDDVRAPKEKHLDEAFFRVMISTEN